MRTRTIVAALLVVAALLPAATEPEGISASPQLGKLYVTSYVKDELVSMDLATDAITW